MDKFKVDEGKNIEFFDLENDPVEKAINLYPYYETEDVHKIASSIDYFDIKNGVISLKNEYKDTLQGKITVPTIDGVTQIGSFSYGNVSGKTSKITHIYFLENSKITTVNMSAFTDCNELEVVDLPKTVRTIKGYAFIRCSKLKTVTLNDNITTIDDNAFSGCSSLELTALPASLTKLGSGAFQTAGPGIKLTTIPSGIEILESWTFNGCPNVKFSTFGGKSGESKLRIIENNCLNAAGKGDSNTVVEDIIINYSVEQIGSNAFYGYATNTLKNVYFARPYEGSPAPYGMTPEQMGFTNPDLNIGQLENV